jgi:hypothetical protein
MLDVVFELPVELSCSPVFIVEEPARVLRTTPGKGVASHLCSLVTCSSHSFETDFIFELSLLTLNPFPLATAFIYKE